MQCPKCHAALSSQTLDGQRSSNQVQSPYRINPAVRVVQELPGAIWVDRCPACKGIWFDAGELAAALRTMAILDIPDPPTDFKLARDGSSRRCPRCSSTMRSKTSRVAPEVHYERCDRCDGVWFDGGEIREFADPWVAMSAMVVREFEDE